MFEVVVAPREGPFAHSEFLFTFKVPQDYPFTPPAVRCMTKVFHPNINWRTGE